ncbi:hypothetical protein [Vibrio crassostreae]|uniref:hypothetical protein n=1 Tax=Vibrio crassostreae TaxID=246167 RepID=UPI00104F2FD6|nr:hypothetical protein [Vibrio crassostreae]TCO04364.1 hypothetical protein EDB51_102297 [Vibrio crassostreae]CAK1923994.1 Outer membrane protein [Vibrio crassostreae]CAK1927794.1 Outer membrane protein [Vibrio crassostreae]CAK1954138.1 Outer membrane protein [Vibrio crassostreae]CAK2689699.1 Outer membrane protein [Vibrio crassostreae]
MKFKTITTASLIIGSLFNTAFAQEEEDFDASDMTRANTTAIIGASNQGDVKLTGSLSYAHRNGQASMALLEGTMDRDGEYSDARLQYFHVFSLDNATTPRIATSLDIIDNDMFTTAALGAIAMVRTGYEPLTFFVRGGILAGSYKDDVVAKANLGSSDITGAMGAAYAVLKTGDDGTFLALYPEYTYLDGDLSIETVKTTLMAATPVSADGKRWGQIKIESTSGNTTMDGVKTTMDTDTVAWFNYKVYF